MPNSSTFGGMLRPAQCRAARALLNWTQGTLANNSQVNELVIRRFEKGQSDPRVSSIGAIERALIHAGIEFSETEERFGVHLRKEGGRG